MPSLSEILKNKISSSGKSKASVAAHLGISERTIENYMNGTRQPKPDALAKMSKFLGFDLNEISVQSVPEGMFEQTAGKETAKHYTNGHTMPVQDKYVLLLEETIKEKKDRVKELETRLNDLEGRQRDFLAKNEDLLQRYEHLVLHQLQEKEQGKSGSTPIVQQRTYKQQSGSQRKGG